MQYYDSSINNQSDFSVPANEKMLQWLHFKLDNNSITMIFKVNIESIKYEA